MTAHRALDRAPKDRGRQRKKSGSDGHSHRKSEGHSSLREYHRAEKEEVRQQARGGAVRAVQDWTKGKGPCLNSAETCLGQPCMEGVGRMGGCAREKERVEWQKEDKKQRNGETNVNTLIKLLIV